MLREYLLKLFKSLKNIINKKEYTMTTDREVFKKVTQPTMPGGGDVFQNVLSKLDEGFVSDVIDFEGSEAIQSSDWAISNLGRKTFEDDIFYPYQDTEGHWTIGYGTKLNEADYNKYKLGMTKDDAKMFLTNRLTDAREQASTLISDFGNRPKEVQEVMTDLVYNMGYGTLSEQFPSFLEGIESGEYQKAMDNLKYSNPSENMTDEGLSKYYKTQVRRSDYNIDKLGSLL
jgi:GH24 family phage-related lysozyme (muramidase)